MPRVSTRNASTFIGSRSEFRTSGSLRGEWQGDRYAVISYSTPIAVWQGGVWQVASRRYSVTTSRHQTAVRCGVVGEVQIVTEIGR